MIKVIFWFAGIVVAASGIAIECIVGAKYGFGLWWGLSFICPFCAGLAFGSLIEQSKDF